MHLILFVLYLVSGGVLGLSYTMKGYRNYNFFLKTRNELIARSLSRDEAVTVRSNYSGAMTGYELIGKSSVIAIY